MSHLHQRKPGALLSLANWVETQDERPGATGNRPVPREPEMRADEAFLNDVSQEMHQLAGGRQNGGAPSIGELLRRRGGTGAEAPAGSLPAVVVTPVAASPGARPRRLREADPVQPEPKPAGLRGKKGIFSRLGGLFSRGGAGKQPGKNVPSTRAQMAERTAPGIPHLPEAAAQPTSAEPAHAANDAEIMAGYFAQLAPEAAAMQQSPVPQPPEMPDRAFGEPYDERDLAPAAQPLPVMPDPQPDMRHRQGHPSVSATARHDPAAQPHSYPQPTPWQPPAPMQFAPSPAGQPYPVWLPQPASAHFYWSTPQQPAPMQPAMPWPGAVPPTRAWEPHEAPAAFADAPSGADLAAEVDEVRERLRDFAELLRELRELRRTG
jgi:hypothetical protein